MSTLTALSSLIVRPAIQQTNPNSPQPFISFILPDSPALSQTVVPILVAVTLPAEISEDYSLSNIFVFAENNFVTTFPLTEEPFFDEKSNSFVWLFFGSYEVSLDQSPNQPLNLIPLTLSAYALFEPFEPSSPSLSAYDEFFVLIDLTSFGSEGEEQEGKESAQAEKSISEKSETSSTGETEKEQVSKEARTSQSKGALKKEAAKRAIEKDPKIARKVFEQEISAKALSNAKKNPKSTAKGNGIVITVGAYPDVLPADGKSTAFIVAKVTNEKGKPLSGRDVSFVSTGGRILIKEAKTNEQGITFSRLLSEPLGKGEKKVVRVRAKTNPEAETEVVLVGGETLTISSSSVTSYAFVYWKKYTPSGGWYCTPKPEYCSEEESGASGLSGIALHVITPLGYWTACPNFVEVIGDGHPDQYRYTETSFQFDQNAPCPPPPNPSNPNQQRFHFSWQPMEGVRWAELHRSGITIRINYTVGRYYPYPPQFWTEEKTFNLDAVNAVLVIDPSSPKVLAWDPENPNQSELTVKFKVDTLQVGRVWVWMRIYACSRANEEGPVKVIEKETTTNMDTLITWDGSTNEGGVADKGLYAYDLFVCVEQLSPEYVDRDRRVSEYLRIERAKDEEGNEIFEAEYYGYDDKGTEEVEDDDHLYFILWYVLKDKEGRNASSGEVWLYDSDLQFVKRWDVRKLQCLEHKGERDGLVASVDGVKHGILVPVPVNLMQKAGTYYFVLRFKDDHANLHKDHQVKPALEMNAEWRKWQITDVGFYYDLNGNGNPYEDIEKLRWDGNDPSNPQPGEFAILRQQPEGNTLFILAHVASDSPPPSNAKVVVMLKTSVTDPKGIKVTLHYSRACPQGNGYHFRKPYGQEIKMVDPPEQSMDDVQIQVHMSGDNTAEVTTYDHATTAGSNYQDSEAIEMGLTGHKKRGRARDKNWEMTTPTLPTMLRFLKAAGVEKKKVFDPTNPSVKHELPVKNQADILYYSGHGSSASGGLLSCWDKTPVLVSDIVPSVNWHEDLDYFIIAGCAVLHPDPTNGFAWGNATLKAGILNGLCGYYASAPSDGGGKSVEVAKAFAAFLTSQQPPIYSGNRVLDAWLEANRKNKSLGIAYNSTQYWKVKQRRLRKEIVEGPFNW